MANLIPYHPFYTNEGVSTAPNQTPMQRVTEQGGLFKFVNKSGAAIALGAALKPDIVAGKGKISIYAAAVITAGSALTLLNDLSSEEGLFRIACTNSILAWDALAAGIVIVGKDYLGNTQTENLATTADGNEVLTSANLYSELTSITPGAIDTTNATAKLTVDAYCINAFDIIATPAADDTALSGICMGAVDGYNSDTVADEGTGWIAMPGKIVQALIYPPAATLQTPGTLLGSSATGTNNLGALSTAAPGGAIARLLDVMGSMDAAAALRWVQLIGA